MGDGSFTIDVTGGSLPCMIQAGSGANALHSVIHGTGGGRTTVNVTPLTELIAARVAGGAPQALFANFNAAAQARVSTTAVQAAIIDVASALQGAVDLAGVDPIRDPLVAASGSTPGNGLDQKLDQLQGVLTSARTTLSELTAALAASGGTPSVVRSLLQPAAASCSGLRSGPYVSLGPVSNDSPEPSVLFFDLDAVALQASYQVNGAAQTATIVDDGGCAYSIPADGSDSSSRILVSKSGIAVQIDTGTAGMNAGQSWLAGIYLPRHNIPMSELAGTWNALEYFRDPVNGQPSFAAFRGSMTFDGVGTITAGTSCNSAAVCAPSEAVGATLRVNTAGGFDIGDAGNPNEPPSRVFVFKSSSGSLSMFLLYSAGRGMIVLSKEAPLSLPAVNATTSIWDFSFTSTGSTNAAQPVVDATYTVTGIDVAGDSFTRKRASDNRIDTLALNSPHPGLRSRATNTCTVNNVQNNCPGLIGMPLPGTGISVYQGIAPQNFFGVTVEKP
jgi:hypothetical protein